MRAKEIIMISDNYKRAFFQRQSREKQEDDVLFQTLNCFTKCVESFGAHASNSSAAEKSLTDHHSTTTKEPDDTVCTSISVQICRRSLTTIIMRRPSHQRYQICICLEVARPATVGVIPAPPIIWASG
ncbi:hypothetical protein Dimus_038171 [Dionaea muscipula]